MIELAKALLFIAVVIGLAFAAGIRWRRKKPSLTDILNLRNAIAAAYPPQVIGQFTPDRFNGFLEEQLRTYLRFAGDLTPPKPFTRPARTRAPEPEEDLHELAIKAARAP